MRKLHIDFETRSRVDLRKVGAWAYAAHPSTEILCVAYSIDGGPVKIVRSEDPVPVDFEAAVKDPSCIVTAHNAAFEYAIYSEIADKLFGAPSLEDPARWDCTLARAAMCNLPISLDACGAALKITRKKDLHGRAVMMKLSRPMADGKFNEDPELLKQLYDYCKKDVEAEMEIDSRLPALPASEKEIWNLDLLINKRGVRMDIMLAQQATDMVGGLTTQLNIELNRLTGGAVNKASRVAEIKRYLAANGVLMGSLNKQAVTELLADKTIPGHIKDVVNIRRQVGKTSTSKYQAILDVAGSGGRARGLMQYHGASTGRWAGRLVQPHNFPKGVSKDMQHAIIDAILARNIEDLSKLSGGNPMDALSGALRGTLIADEGSQMVVADYKTIEPRVLFWLAGETGALEAYRSGADLYVDLARVVFGDPTIDEKRTFERSVGKFGVLGCGYGMGAPRFQAQCATAGVDISIELAGKTIRAYRDKYSKVVRLWREVEAAAKKAVREPELHVSVCENRVMWFMDAKREFLCCRLPSGRLLRYFKPSLVPTEFGPELHYQGPGLGGVLEDQKTYGGSLVENVVQAIARDILAGALLRLEIDGFDILFHVHDEIVASLKPVSPGMKLLPELQLAAFITRMCVVPEWAPGLPLAAEGWVGERYRK